MTRPYLRALLIWGAQLISVGAAVAAILASQVGSASAKDWTALRLGTDPTSPPQESLRPDGTMEGFDIDLAADICARINAKCEWVQQDWKDIIPALNAGKFDVIFVGMLMTDNRRTLIDFSIPFTVVRQGLLVQATGPLSGMEPSDKIVSLSNAAAAKLAISDLANALKMKAVGADAGTPRAAMAKEYFQGSNLRTYPSLPAALGDLLASHIDAEVAPSGFIGGSLRGPDGAKLKRVGPWFNGGLLGEGVGIGLRKSDPELKAMLDTAIQAALADGTVRRLALKWYQMDITPPL